MIVEWPIICDRRTDGGRRTLLVSVRVDADATRAETNAAAVREATARGYRGVEAFYSDEEKG